MLLSSMSRILVDSTNVDIGRFVSYETLERALNQAAEEMGWKARVEDQHRRSYQLGSVKEVSVYRDTTVFLRRGWFPVMGFPVMEVGIYDKKSTDRFTVWTGLPAGIVSEKKVQEYLRAVSNYLQA